MNNLFEGIKDNDSKDLINLLLMNLHKELNEGKKCNNIKIPPQEDQMSLFKYFQQKNNHENKSIISDLNVHIAKLKNTIFTLKVFIIFLLKK